MLDIPLKIEKGKIKETSSLSDSIEKNLEQILEAPLYSWVVDDNYGFLLNNLRFENFNEKEGRIESSPNKLLNRDLKKRIYELSITGNSDNNLTFASELKHTISEYEPRLEDLKISMTYLREYKVVTISIKGNISATKQPFSYVKNLRIWK